MTRSILDEKDRLLLGSLRKDARRSLVSLARDCGLSRTATQDRIARLRAEGVIRAFTIEEGSPSKRQGAHLLVKLSPGRTCAQTLPALRKILDIGAVFSVAGEFDMIIHVESDAMTAIEAVRASVAAIPQVADVTTFVTLDKHDLAPR